MKHLSLFCFCMCLFLTAFCNVLDEAQALALTRAFQKSARYPDKARHAEIPGAVLLKLTKYNDALLLETVYTSNEAFTEVNGKDMLSQLKKVSPLLPDTLEYFIPLYFELDANGNLYTLSKKDIRQLNSKIISLGSPSTMLNPILIKGYSSTNCKRFEPDAKPEALAIQVYPNPAHGQLTFHIPDQMLGVSLTLEIFTAQGNMVLRKTICPEVDRDVLPLNGIKPGTYILQLTNTKHIASEKLIIK